MVNTASWLRRGLTIGVLTLTPAMLAGQGGPAAGSPRMAAITAVQSILSASESELPGILDSVVAPGMRADLGAAGLAELVSSLRSHLGGREAGGMRPTGPTAVTLNFDGDDGTSVVRVSVEAEPPHRLKTITLETPGDAPEEVAADSTGYDSLNELASALLTNLSTERYQAIVDSQLSARLRGRYGSEQITEYLRVLREGLGPVDGTYPVLRVGGEESDRYVITQNQDSTTLRFGVRVTDGPPYRVDGFDATPVAALPNRSLPVAEWPEAIEEFVGGRAAEGNFSGAVIVARHGEPVFAGTWGMADRGTGRELTPDTPINIGSINKMFTGLAIGQLEAKGLLSYDDTVGTFLPDYPNATVRSQVTIHQLLTHTSGVPSYWNDAYEATKDDMDTLEETAATFADEPLLFQPGTEWRYSNGGPVVLGLIVERITGQSYYEYVRESIYRPAGMTATDHYLKTDSNAGFAIGYHAEESGQPLEPNTEWLGLRGSPAGGGYSSAHDFMRFSEALSDGRLLGADDLARLWEPEPRGSEEDRYGYLWGVGRIGRQRWVGHNGGGPGISADFKYFPDSGYVVAVLANQSRVAMPVSQWLTALVAREG